MRSDCKLDSPEKPPEGSDVIGLVPMFNRVSRLSPLNAPAEMDVIEFEYKYLVKVINMPSTLISANKDVRRVRLENTPGASDVIRLESRSLIYP